MNPDQFAETIKAKYPAYKNVDNLTLAKKVIEKYPVYASKVNFNTAPTSQSIISSLAKKTLPGASTALIPAKPAGETGLGFGDLAKSIPNALGDIWSLIKEGTYGTAKKVLYDIPKEATALLKEQGVGQAYKNYASSVPGAIKDTAASLVPQSAKELLNTNAIAEIPTQFKEVVKQNKGSYAKALISIVKAAPGAVPDAVQNYADQIDRARQAVENHPVNEFLGWLGIKQLAVSGAKTPIGSKAPGAKTAIGTDPATVAKMFESEGIKPPVSALTDNRAVRGMEALSSKGMFGTKVQEIASKAMAEVENRTNQLVDRIKPGKALSDESLGKTLQEGLKEYEEKFKVTEEKIYREFEKTYGKSNVYGKGTKDALHTLIDEQSKDFVGGVDPVLNRALDRISGRKNPELLAIEDQINEFKSRAGGKVPPEVEKAYQTKQAQFDKQLTFEELKATRTKVGELMQRNPENTAYKRLYGALSEDMKTAVTDVIKNDPLVDNAAKEAAASLEKLNKGYQTGKAKIESNIAQSISKSNPESIAKNIIKRNSADTIKTVKEMVGEKRFEEVRHSFLRQILGESVTRDKFDVAKLKKKMGEYDQATLNEILNPTQLKELNNTISQLEKYSTMDKALKSGVKMSEGSQTAFLSKLGVVPGLVFSGHVFIAASILLGDFALKTLFTSNLGRKLLTEGLTAGNLKAVKDYKGLPTASKQLIIQNMRSKDKN